MVVASLRPHGEARTYETQEQPRQASGTLCLRCSGPGDKHAYHGTNYDAPKIVSEFTLKIKSLIDGVV